MLIRRFLVPVLLYLSVAAAGQPPARQTFYQRLSVKPHFPGDSNALHAFIYGHLRYPDDARESGTEGRSVIRFMIDEYGAINHVEAVRSSGSSSLDAEANASLPLCRIGFPVSTRAGSCVCFTCCR